MMQRQLVLPAASRPLGPMPDHQTYKPHEQDRGSRYEQERGHRPSPSFSISISSGPPNSPAYPPPLSNGRRGGTPQGAGAMVSTQ